jgi:hypothetical protein
LPPIEEKEKGENREGKREKRERWEKKEKEQTFQSAAVEKNFWTRYTNRVFRINEAKVLFVLPFKDGSKYSIKRFTNC